MSQPDQSVYVGGMPVIESDDGGRAIKQRRLHRLGTFEMVAAIIGFVLLVIGILQQMTSGAQFSWFYIINDMTLGGVPLLISGVLGRRLAVKTTRGLMLSNRIAVGITIGLTAIFIGVRIYLAVVLATVTEFSAVPVYVSIVNYVCLAGTVAVFGVCVAHLINI